MMLNTLVDLSQREGLILSYEPKPVHFFIHIGKNGPDCVKSRRQSGGSR